MENRLRAAFPDGSVLHAATLRRAARRAKLYAIFLTPRSGSTWLTELAIASGRLGAPQEWFNDGWIYEDRPALGCKPPRLRGTAEINAYVNAIIDEGQGVAGIQLSCFQAAMLAELIEPEFDPTCLTTCFYLRRRDICAQAVSLYRSVESALFHSYEATPERQAAFAAVPYDTEKLIHWTEFLLESEARFDALFKAAGLSPTPIFYEDLIADPLRVLGHIAANLAITPPDVLPNTVLIPLRDEKSAVWVDRLRHALPQDLQTKLAARTSHPVNPA